jgi:hypothetical protein
MLGLALGLMAFQRHCTHAEEGPPLAERWEISLYWSGSQIVRGQGIFLGAVFHNRTDRILNGPDPLHGFPLPIMLKRPGKVEWVPLRLWRPGRDQSTWRADEYYFRRVDPGKVEYTGAWLCLELTDVKDRRARHIFDALGRYDLKVQDFVHHVQVVDGESWFQDLASASLFLGSQTDRADRLQALEKRLPSMSNRLDQILGVVVLGSTNARDRFDKAIAMASDDPPLRRALATQAYLATGRHERYRALLDAGVPGSLPTPIAKPEPPSPPKRPAWQVAPGYRPMPAGVEKESPQELPPEYQELVAAYGKALQAGDVEALLDLCDWDAAAQLGYTRKQAATQWAAILRSLAPRFKAERDRGESSSYRAFKREPLLPIDGVPDELAPRCEGLFIHLEKGGAYHGRPGRVVVIRHGQQLRFLYWRTSANCTPTQAKWMADFRKQLEVDLDVLVRRRDNAGREVSVPLRPVLLRTLGLDPAWSGQWWIGPRASVGPGSRYYYEWITVVLADRGPYGPDVPLTEREGQPVGLVLDFSGPVPEILGAIGPPDIHSYRFCDEVDATKLPLPPLKP